MHLSQTYNPAVRKSFMFSLITTASKPQIPKQTRVTN